MNTFEENSPRVYVQGCQGTDDTSSLRGRRSCTASITSGYPFPPDVEVFKKCLKSLLEWNRLHEKVAEQQLAKVVFEKTVLFLKVLWRHNSHDMVFTFDILVRAVERVGFTNRVIINLYDI